MTSEELETLRRDIDDLRRAVRKANPFLRAVVELRGYAILSIPLGILVLAICLASHFLILHYSSFKAVPSTWKSAFGIAFAAFLTGAWVLKWMMFSRRVAEVEKGATALTAMRAMYGGVFIINLPIILCMFVIGAFTIVLGHPWFIVSTFAIGLGLVCISFAASLERREYLVTGWYAIVTGLVALFFLESAPFIWAAVVWAGIFLVYAASALHYLPREEKAG